MMENLQLEAAPSLRRRLAAAFARLIGWRVDTPAALPARCVIIGAPHTTSMDLWLALLMIEVGGHRFQWVMKDTLFRGPLGPFFRALGGVPVNRRARTNFVDGVVEIFDREPVFRLAIVPEGTRQKADGWKTGFYYIAVRAQVPFVFGYVDFPRKTVGLGPTFFPTGDIEADFDVIRAFYRDKQGKYPDQQGEIRIRPAQE